MYLCGCRAGQCLIAGLARACASLSFFSLLISSVGGPCVLVRVQEEKTIKRTVATLKKGPHVPLHPLLHRPQTHHITLTVLMCHDAVEWQRAAWTSSR